METLWAASSIMLAKAGSRKSNGGGAAEVRGLIGGLLSS